MRLVILDDYDRASEWAARFVKKRIHNFNPGPEKFFTLGLPTGDCAAYIDGLEQKLYTLVPFVQCIQCFAPSHRYILKLIWNRF